MTSRGVKWGAGHNRWLAEWLLANNPNKPKVGFVEDAFSGGEEEEEKGVNGYGVGLGPAPTVAACG